MIRGAIAFGLVLKLDDNLDEKEVITTTALSLVIFTTLLFGSAMPLVQKCLVPPKEQEKYEYEEVDGVAEAREGTKINTSEEEHEEFLHPNMRKDSQATADNFMTKGANGDRLTHSQYVKERKKRFNSCASCLKRFDDLIMKPIMIYRYDQELIKKKDEFLELFMKEGEMWEKLYMHEEPMEAFEDVRSQRGNSVMRHIGSLSQRRSMI